MLVADEKGQTEEQPTRDLRGPSCCAAATLAVLMSLVSLRRSGEGGSIPLSRKDLTRFLPTTREEMNARGWDALDILIVNGDAYVDHPAFGGALIGRFLEARGYRVGMIAQPRWDSTVECDEDDNGAMGTERCPGLD